eukprot:INCI11085.1.p1 GENE.INCI11085.1~~INCI11085.1.p1  ORF type:complete len:278 (-),score=59.70 INCI11085.1:251-1084(-)
MSTKHASTLDKCKAKAALAAVGSIELEEGMTVGIGSGSTVVHAVRQLEAKCAEAGVVINCVATSFQAEQLIVESPHMRLVTLSSNPELAVAIDGADEIDPQLNLIKGGGGCALREKVVAACTKKMLVIADYTKWSKQLGTVWLKGIPLEVLPVAYVPVQRKLIDLGASGAPLRMSSGGKAGPVVTDHGNFIVDANFEEIEDPAVLNQQLLNIPGVLGTGLFIGMASTAFIAGKDGNVKVRHRAPIARQLESADLLDGEKGDVEDVGGEEGRVENVAE